MNKTTKRRKGFVATLEAALASAIFLTFIITILPGFTQTDVDTLTPWENKISEILDSLDKTNELRGPALNLNLTKIDNMVDNYTPADLDHTVGILYSDYTRGSLSISDSGNVSFNINKSRSQSEYLRLYLENVSSPELKVNANSIWSSQGDFNDSYRSFSIISYTSDGTNNFSMNVSSTSKLDYRIDRYYYIQKGTLPSEGKIISSSYHPAGENFTLKPMEVRVFGWR